MKHLAPTLLIALLPTAVAGQPICLPPDTRAPFVDGEVMACADVAPMLTLAREAAIYDPDLGEWRQAILLRFANPFDDEAIVSGVLDLEGAELIGEPEFAGVDLRRGDFEWAIAPLSHYQDRGDCSALENPPGPHPGRGLEFGDLLRYGPDSVRFEFAAAADLDDIRLIVSSPDPAPAGTVHITLFDVLTTPGVQIQVGAADADLTPDDGRYPAELQVSARLRALDLDIPQDCVSGPVDGVFAFELLVPDPPPDRPAGRDPRLDSNGALSPIDALGAPAALRWRPTELVSDAGDTLLVAALDGLDLDLCIDDQVSLPLDAFIEPADDRPAGVYGGTIDVWSDTNDNRRFDRSEVGDTVRIAAVVGPDPGVDPCEVVAVSDAGAPDAGLDGGLDAAIDVGLDAELDAAADTSVDAEVLDAGGADRAGQPLDGPADTVSPDAGLGGDARPDPNLDAGGALDAGRDGATDAAPALDGTVTDGGGVDAASSDAGIDDRGPADRGLVDAAVDAAGEAGVQLDGGPADIRPDGARSDAIPPDAAADARPPDAQSDGPTADGMPSDGAPADRALDASIEPPVDGSPAVDATATLDAQPEDLGDPQGGALSCRAAPGSAPAGGGWLICLCAVLVLRRRRASLSAVGPFLALLLAVIWLSSASEASAQADVRRFSPTPTLSPYVNLDGSGTLGAGRLGARLLSVVEQRPLVFARDGDRTVDIVSLRLSLDTALAVGVTDWLDVGVGLPLVLLQDGRQVTRDADLHGFALADPSLGAKFRFLRAVEGVGLAVRLSVTAPLGDPDALSGEQGPTGTAVVAVELPVLARFDLVLDVGYRLREATRLGEIALDDELIMGVGASWRATTNLALALEFGAATAAADPFAVSQQTPGGLDLIARLGIFDDLAAVGGIGLGLLPGYGSPALRGVVGLQYAPRNHDFDGDGLADGRDDCIRTAGVALERGCPLPERVVVAPREPVAPSRDQDRDDILDALDQCPFLAEDRDGFRDDDGCPDVDNDLDLIADGFDADPLGPEDWDGFEDADGIPDVDNDRDGLADDRDPCPDVKGGADGCAGSLMPRGPDIDGTDSLAGADGPQAPLVLGRTLHPADPIIFEFARPELSEAAAPFVDGLARYLAAHPELERVEVGVHVDAMGSRRWKHWLSRARAESVVAALVARGVASERVFPRGYGPEVPVDDNRTKAGRAKNRRVELRALRSFESPEPTQARPPREKARPKAVRSRPDKLPPPRPRWLPPDTLVLRATAPLAFVRGERLAPRSVPRVVELARRLASNPDWRRVEVAVHTDGAGDTDSKLRVSQRRAQAVVDALVAEGIESDRLVPRGYGARRRLVEDDSPERRAVNRRVELVVIDTSISLVPTEDAP